MVEPRAGKGSRPGADVGDVGLPPHEHLGAAKVTQLELVGLRVHQQVLRLNIPMAHLHAVYVRQRAAHLHRQTRSLSASSERQGLPQTSALLEHVHAF